MPLSSTFDLRKGARGRGVFAKSARSWGASGEVALGSGFGKDWNVLSARRPSPVKYVSSLYFLIHGFHTNKEHQAFRGRFLSFHAVLAHTMNNRAHKVNREDAVDVDEVKYHRHNEKAIPPKLCHGKDCGGGGEPSCVSFVLLIRRSTPMAKRSRRNP